MSDGEYVKGNTSLIIPSVGGKRLVGEKIGSGIGMLKVNADIGIGVWRIRMDGRYVVLMTSVSGSQF